MQQFDNFSAVRNIISKKYEPQVKKTKNISDSWQSSDEQMSQKVHNKLRLCSTQKLMKINKLYRQLPRSI